MKNSISSHLQPHKEEVAFGNGKFGTIVGIGKIGESLSHSIDCIYLIDGL